MTTTTPALPSSAVNGMPPVLQSATPSGAAGSISLDLVFSTAMMAGVGAIYVTDGAVETVIDRATGQPAMRVVGATDTHVLSVSDLGIDGNHVTLDVAGLLPGHGYSVVMGSGVLLSAGHVAFGGVRGTSQLTFSTPAGPDTTAPSVASASIDGSVLKAGASLDVTIVFSEAIKSLGADALAAPNASVTGLTTSDGGLIWHATVTAPAGAVTAAANLLTLDLSKVQDLAGNAGSGSSQLASYAVDTQAPAGAGIVLDAATLKAGDTVGVSIAFSEAVQDLSPDAILTPHARLANLHSDDGGLTWHAQLTPVAGTTADGNMVSVDLSKVVDLAGNAGSGSFSSASYAVDTQAPTVAQFQLDGGLVTSGQTVGVTLRFSEKVTLDAGAFDAPGAAIGNLHTDDDGLTWHATLGGAGPAEASGLQLALDMSKVHDLAGNAGGGSAHAAQTYDVDTKGPSASIALDGTELQAGGAIGVTIALSDKLDALPAGALSAPNATLQDLHTSDGGLTWQATLVADAGALAATNAVSLDLSQLHDAHGNAGVGVASSANYAVDAAVAAYVGHQIDILDWNGPDSTDHVSNDPYQVLSGSLSGALQDGQQVLLTIDGQVVGAGIEGFSWFYGGDGQRFDDGVHTVTAQVVDGDGHASAAFTQQFTIDTTHPELLASPDGASGVGTGDALTFTFSEAMYAASGTSTALHLSDAQGDAIEVGIGAANFSADRKTLTFTADQLHLLPGQDYTVYLPEDLTDLAGNALASLTPLHFHTGGADTLAPSATAATAQVADGVYGVGTRIAIALSFSEAVRVDANALPVLHLSNGGLAVYDHVGADGRTILFTYTVGANGESDSDNLQLADSAGLAGHVSDLAGNALDAAHIDYANLDNLGGDGHAIRIDAHVPDAPGAPQLAAGGDSGIAGDAITALNRPALNGGGAAGAATVRLFEGDTLLATTTSDADGNWHLGAGDWNAALADGSHALAVRQYDDANDASPLSGVLTISVDTTAPAAAGQPVLAASSDSGASSHDGITNVAAPTIGGSAAEAGGSVQLYDGATLLGTAAVGADKAWSFTVGSQAGAPATLADGVHELSVRQADAAGNLGAASAALSIAIDTTPPAAPGAPALAAGSDSGLSATDRITNVNTPTLTGSAAEAGGSIALYDGATLLGTTAVGADKAWSFSVGSQPGYPAVLADGAHTLTVKQIDVAGNASASSAPLAVSIDTVAPIVTTSGLAFKNGGVWFDLNFSEQVVFATNGEVDVLDPFGNPDSQHSWNVGTNWDIANDSHGVPNVLELKLGGLGSLFHLQLSGNPIQDVAGNVALIGIGSFGLAP